MTDTTLQLWGVIGTWVASIGTVSAVVVSLWLASGKNKVKLKIRATLAYEATAHAHKILWIRVVNIGNYPVCIKNFGLEDHRGKIKNYLLLLSNGNIIQTGLLSGLGGVDNLKIINYGEEVDFSVPLSKLVSEFLKRNYSEKDIRKNKVVVVTSVGEFTAKIEKDFVDELIKAISANRK